MLIICKTYYKNLAVFTPRDLKYVWPFFNIKHERFKNHIHNPITTHNQKTVVSRGVLTKTQVRKTTLSGPKRD